MGGSKAKSNGAYGAGDSEAAKDKIKAANMPGCPRAGLGFERIGSQGGPC